MKQHWRQCVANDPSTDKLPEEDSCYLSDNEYEVTACHEAGGWLELDFRDDFVYVKWFYIM